MAENIYFTLITIIIAFIFIAGPIRMYHRAKHVYPRDKNESKKKKDFDIKLFIGLGYTIFAGQSAIGFSKIAAIIIILLGSIFSLLFALYRIYLLPDEE